MPILMKRLDGTQTPYEAQVDYYSNYINCLRLIDRQWNNVFRLKLSIDYRTWSKELMGVRNDASHIGQKDFEARYAERALDTMASHVKKWCKLVH